MKSYSKVTFFSLLIIFSSIIISCDSNTDLYKVLPDIPETDIIVNLDYSDNFCLQNTGEAKIIPSYAGKKIGYKGHGIIVIRTYENEYKAWDATSTYDFNIALTTDGALAKCPESLIEYELYTGTPHKQSSIDTESLKGISSLQEYYCRKISTNTLRISNKRH